VEQDGLVFFFCHGSALSIVPRTKKAHGGLVFRHAPINRVVAMS
jgi:hypothetical protein